MENYLVLLKKKFNILITKKYFDFLYVFCIMLISLLGWFTSSYLGICCLLIVFLIVSFLSRDLKYGIPIIIFMIFTINMGFSSSEFPIVMLIFVICLIIFLILNYFFDVNMKKKMHFFIGLAGLALTNLLPIFWVKNLENFESLYFLFFSDLLYLVLYFFMSKGIHNNSMEMLAISMSLLGFMLCIQCFSVNISNLTTKNNFIRDGFYLGWGLCNEAGIMILMAISFSFYFASRKISFLRLIFFDIILCFSIYGILLTYSRGSYLFLIIMLFFEFLISVFRIKNKYWRINFAVLAFVFLIAFLILVLNNKFQLIIQNVFFDLFNGTGREELWTEGLGIWKNNFITIIFGSGIASSIRESITAAGTQESIIVFHSYIVQTLVMSGLIGIVFLLILFYEKYFFPLKADKNFFLFIGCGFLVLDLYGLIDNTYHMYYFMIPLSVILAVLDNCVYPPKKEGYLY